MTKSTTITLTIGAMLLAFSGAARADLGPATDYNVFILGSASQFGTDAEGRVAVGGSATYANYGVGSSLPNSHGQRDDLIVGGSLSYSSGQVFAGNIRSGGAAALWNVGIPNGRYIAGNPVDFAAAGSWLTNTSASLAALTPNGTGGNNGYGQFLLNGTSTDVNVFSLQGSQLATANYLRIAAPAGSTCIVNIDGSTDQMANFGIDIQGTDRSKVLYNFSGAGNLLLSGIGIEGSILAPRMAVNFVNGQINGTLIGASLTGNGEAHLHPFTGNIPTNSASVPEPGTLAMTAIGLLPLVGMTRRRKQA